DKLALDSAANKIRPQEFTEGRRILGKSAGPSQLSGQRPEWIVNQIADRFRYVLMIASAAVVVKRVHQVSVVQHDPKCVAFEHAEICNHRNHHLLHTFFLKSACKVMVIDDIVAFLWTKDHRDHMSAEKFGALFALH